MDIRITYDEDSTHAQTALLYLLKRIIECE